MRTNERARTGTKARAWLAVAALACLLTLMGLAGCASSGGSGESAESASSEAANASAEANGESGTELVVAMELAYPPFETRDEAGNPSGLSVDFMEAFGEAYGYDITIENTAFDGLLPSLQSGRADAVMSSITITDEREETVDFTDPYARAQLAILANASSGIESADDLNQAGKRVAVKTGSTGYIYAQEHLTNAEIVALADESACVQEVVQGKADGFLYDQLTIYRNWQANQDTTEAVFIPFQDPEYWGIAVQTGNDELREQFNEFIAQCLADGTFDELTQKHLAEEKASFDELGFVWFFDLDEGATVEAADEGPEPDAGTVTASGANV